MTEALMGTCILAITTIIFVWVCSEYQIYNNEHSAEEKLNATRLSDWLAARELDSGWQWMTPESIRRKC